MTLLALAALAALTQHPYTPCAHTPTTKAPVLSPAAREMVAEEIRAEVAAGGGSPALAAYLVHVARRESQLLPGVIHLHEKDRAAAAAAFARFRGHPGHQFAGRRELWLSYGLFGQNSNYHEALPDPRQLCTVRGAVGAYMKATRSALRRMRSCSTSPPTWGDVHRAIQGGKLCPNGRRQKIPMAEVRVRPGDLGGRAT
jgi:hypothetical protein